MSWKRHRALAFVLLLTASACTNCNCGGPILNPIPPHPDQQDEFCQRPASKVDILWVIDNSGSMSSEQSKLADRFAQFFKQLNASLVDYHIGVVTTSLREGFTEEVNGILRKYGGNVPGCDNCRYLTKDVPCDSSKMDRQEQESTQDFEARLVNDCPAALVFRKLVSAGDMGSPFETGLQASTLALGAVIDPETGAYRQGNNGPLIPSQNEGFVRRRQGTCDPSPGSAGLDCSTQPQDNCSEPSLYVIYVSDEQDNSPGLSRYYYRVIEGLKGPGNEGKISVSAITGWPNTATIAMDHACDVLRNSYDNDPSNDGEFNALKTILENGDSNEPACRDTKDPDMGTNGAKVGSRYIDVVCRTGGQLANLCSDDYSTALEKLGADAAGLARRFTLSQWSEIYWGDDGQSFTADDPDLNCDGNPELHPASDKGLCVRATPLNGNNEEVNVPRDNALGYHLESSTHSIRFDGSFLPKPGTKVTIRYQLQSAQAAK